MPSPCSRNRSRREKLRTTVLRLGARSAFRREPETISVSQKLWLWHARRGGDQHHFRFVQLPFSLAMPEAFALANQEVEKQKMPLLAAAAKLGIAVVGSATLYQGHLAHGVPEPVRKILGLNTDAENAIQFARSAPGLCTALVGMARQEHVAANVKVALVPPTPKEEWSRLFQ